MAVVASGFLLLLCSCGGEGSEGGGAPSTVDAAALYREECSECHRLGRYDPEGMVELSRKGNLVPRHFAVEEEHYGITLSTEEIEAMADFLNTH